MTTHIWACYGEEPPFPPEMQAAGAVRAYLQSADENWFWVDYEGDLPTAQEVYDAMHGARPAEANQ